MMRPVREIAQGKWRGILPHFGIDPALLTGKQGPCPMCGGRTKFRFDDKDGRGTWICNSSSCGAGDGVQLVLAKTGLSFLDVAKQIESLAGETASTPAKAEQSEQSKRDAMNSLWRNAGQVQAGDAVDQYLRARLGVIAIPPTLRTAVRCRYQDSVVSFHPAMIAKVVGPDGRPATLHRTYLTNDGRKADVACVRRNMPGHIPDGSAVRLCAPGAVLGIAEGIENAFAASKLFNLPTWAALNEVMLAKWRPPEGVTEVIVFGDNDPKFVGQASAYALARRISERGIEARVMIPDLISGQHKTDWNDVLRLRA
ncbi:toprim domain-containing protein [Lichenihabitans sp. PAMC28606]|uniref:DUF7146 domain-containing protein n=1 Tax=Lichenihabitans sp. PAMC28606 TaxID=2880932 RepID=UPI001D0A134C|nr:toprim domain-containing protein [Lichenihabitans sp. PAMC28606]UDL95482.1 toprim domain-containing protein [Lichenihabitans sp. PAMC28606]